MQLILVELHKNLWSLLHFLLLLWEFFWSNVCSEVLFTLLKLNEKLPVQQVIQLNACSDDVYLIYMKHLLASALKWVESWQSISICETKLSMKLVDNLILSKHETEKWRKDIRNETSMSWMSVNHHVNAQSRVMKTMLGRRHSII